MISFSLAEVALLCFSVDWERGEVTLKAPWTKFESMLADTIEFSLEKIDFNSYIAKIEVFCD